MDCVLQEWVMELFRLGERGRGSELDLDKLASRLRHAALTWPGLLQRSASSRPLGQRKKVLGLVAVQAAAPGVRAAAGHDDAHHPRLHGHQLAFPLHPPPSHPQRHEGSSTLEPFVLLKHKFHNLQEAAFEPVYRGAFLDILNSYFEFIKVISNLPRFGFAKV